MLRAEIRTRWPLLPIALWAAGALVFFRQPIFSGFDLITGDNGDTRLIIYLQEHWVQVMRGASSWRDPAFFYPTGDTLGYSDTFILNEVFYAPLRLSGLDVFVAFQWTLILGSLVGYAGAFRLCRRILPAQRITCALLALTFTFSNMLAVQAGHSQLYSVYWLPIFLLLFLRARETRNHLPALLAGLLSGMLFLSTYYVAWFFVLCSVLWIIAFALLQRSARTWSRRAVRAVARTYRSRAVTFGVGSAVGLVPFLIVYLPISGAGGRSYGVAMSYAAEPLDIINTGRRNYLWGALTRRIFDHSPRLANGELGFGLTPITLILLLLGAGYLGYRTVSRSTPRPDNVAVATAIVAVASILLPMKFWGVSAWLVVWTLVPGAHAVRAIDRIGVIVGLLAPLVVAFAIADVARRASASPGLHRKFVVVSMVIAIITALEQFNIDHNAGLHRAAELAALAAVPTPPSACRAFFLTVPAGRPALAYVSSIDAMLISEDTGLPTINGFSGQFPAGYGAVADPGSAQYQTAVKVWITTHQITDGMCSYRPETRSWSLYKG